MEIMRTQFFWLRKMPPWFHTDAVGWDAHCLYFFLVISHSALAIGVFAVLYMRITMGRTDLATHAFRIISPIKAWGRKSKRRQEIAFVIDLLKWLRPNWYGLDIDNDSTMCIWAEIPTGCCDVQFSAKMGNNICLRISQNPKMINGIRRNPHPCPN